jgi:predicted helicase
LYYDPVLNDRPGAFHEYLPSQQPQQENRLICVNLTPERPFTPIAACLTPSKDLAGGFGSPSYCFPFDTYAKDGSERRENITDWALQEFQTRYGNPRISKWDIFHYVYAVLHHPQYRERYAANLRRELPRIPLVAQASSGNVTKI